MSKQYAAVVALLVFAVTWSTSFGQAGIQPSFHGIGGLSNGQNRGWANAVSGDGRVTVGTSPLSPGVARAFRFENGQIAELTGAPPGFTLSEAFGVSYDGSVIVGVGVPTGGEQEAFRWENGLVTRLGDLQGGLPRSVATAVSADGRIVVGNGYASANYNQAFRWESGVMVGLGSLPGGTPKSSALGVSGDGRVIVGVSGAAPNEAAFRWSNGVMAALELPSDAFWSSACDVSGDGTVIAGWTYGKDSGAQLVRWVHGTIEMLGVGPPGAGCAASGDGSTIVWEFGPIWSTSFGSTTIGSYLADTLGLNL